MYQLQEISLNLFYLVIISPHCLTCSKLPVKGLMLWCQVCGHGGHYREIYDWFSGHDECPTGCHHKCFTIRRKAVKEIMPAFKTN